MSVNESWGPNTGQHRVDRIWASLRQRRGDSEWWSALTATRENEPGGQQSDRSVA